MVKANTAVVVLALAIVACSGTGAEPETTTTTAIEATTSTSPDELAIPFGTYVKVDTREALLSSGTDESLIDEIFGSADEVTYTMRIGDGIWAQFVAIGDSPSEPGDGGTYAYEDGLFLAKSESEGASGTTQAMTWQLDGDRLTLHIDWDHSTAPESEVQREADSMVVDGVYDKTG